MLLAHGYNFGIFVKERRRCYFKSHEFITKESQQYTNIIITHTD